MDLFRNKILSKSNDLTSKFLIAVLYKKRNELVHEASTYDLKTNYLLKNLERVSLQIINILTELVN